MNLLVISYKVAWPSAQSPSGYATDGGFPFQMRALSELFAQTRLLLPCSDAERVAGEAALTGKQLSIIPLTPPQGSDRARKLRFPFWLLRNLPRLCREVYRADAVHTPLPGDVGTIGLLLALALRKPLLVRYCGNWAVQATTAERFWRWLIERIAGGRNVCFATGGDSAPPSMVNPNVQWIFATALTQAELDDYAAVRAADFGNAPKLVIACRQEAEKGTGAVIAALPQLTASFPGITFDVIGDGGALAQFKRAAAECEVAERVRFHGRVPHKEVMRWVRAADLFCFPTTSSEGFPKAVLEALACGLPVVTTRVSVLPCLLSHGCGALIDRADAPSVAAAVTQCLSNPTDYQRMSQAAIATAQQYSLERWRDQIGVALQQAWGELSSTAPSNPTGSDSAHRNAHIEV